MKTFPDVTEIDMCCGNCCDKNTIIKEERATGAKEFAKFLDEALEEDCSSQVVFLLLQEFLSTLQ